MAFLPLPDAASARGPTRDLLDATRARWGFTPNIVRALALRPDLAEAEDAWSRALMREGKLPRVLKEAVATAVSVANRCDYCATSHAYAARREGGAGFIDACSRLDFHTLPLRERAALDFAVKAARDMRSVTERDVAAVRAHFTDEELIELVLVVGSFMMYNTFVTALGLEIEGDAPHGGTLLGKGEIA